MRSFKAVAVGLVLGVAVMLGVLRPWIQKSAKPHDYPALEEWGDSELVPFANAEDLIREGRLDEARRSIKSDLESNPGSALGFALLAYADIRDGRPESAQGWLAKAAAIDPQLFERALFQGHLDMVTRNHRAAIRSYEEALKRQPGHARALAASAAARFELREFAGAVADSSAALGSDPRGGEAYFTRAAAYGALGRHDEAVRDWTAYLAFFPKDAQAWSNRGNSHGRMGRKAAAVADWTQAIKLDPELRGQLGPLIDEAKQ
jgi:tetratricopeptide (TPR) repeat protein